MTQKSAKANLTPIRQRTQYTCMGASLSMALSAQGVDADEDTVNKVMGCKPMQGASWEQAIGAAQHFGMRATLVSPCALSQLKDWTDRGVAVMIAWNPEGRDWSHASCVFDVDDDGNIHIADPNIPDPDQTVRVIPKDEFFKKWFEKWPNYLVRRPALAIEREITKDGRQILAFSKKAEGSDRRRDRELGVRNTQESDDPKGDKQELVRRRRVSFDAVAHQFVDTIKGWAVHENNPEITESVTRWLKTFRTPTEKIVTKLLQETRGLPHKLGSELHEIMKPFLPHPSMDPWMVNIQDVLPYKQYAHLGDKFQTPVPALVEKNVVDSALSEKLQILEALVRRSPEYKVFTDKLRAEYESGRNPDADDLKRLRNFLYKSSMRSEADHFRMASTKKAEGSYLVRRPALAIEREITKDGRQILAKRSVDMKRLVDMELVGSRVASVVLAGRLLPQFPQRTQVATFDGWKPTMGGYQVTTLGGEKYLTLFDLSGKGIPGQSPDLYRSHGKYEVEFQVGPPPEGWGLPQAHLVRVVSPL